MDQNKSTSPAPLFMLLMILGNFMLLNLFLAILLKSISSAPPDGADEGAAEAPADGAAEGAADGAADGAAEGAAEGEEAPEEAAAEPKAPEPAKPKAPEPAPEGDGRKPTEEMLASSCSNVEEEFE